MDVRVARYRDAGIKVADLSSDGDYARARGRKASGAENGPATWQRERKERARAIGAGGKRSERRRESAWASVTRRRGRGGDAHREDRVRRPAARSQFGFVRRSVCLVLSCARAPSPPPRRLKWVCVRGVYISAIFATFAGSARLLSSSRGAFSLTTISSRSPRSIDGPRVANAWRETREDRGWGRNRVFA